MALRSHLQGCVFEAAEIHVQPAGDQAANQDDKTQEFEEDYAHAWS
jgi:hypothetical protein